MTAVPVAHPVPADQPARDLVSRDGLDRTLFVEAGAGTGKTTQLVERVVNTVLGGRGVRLAEIAAITFTEAAAAELQSRIRVAFEQRAESTDDPDVRARCRDAVQDADLAAISTLHGFASRLLAEYAIAAGLPPQVRVLDEVASELAAQQRWTRFVDGLFDDPANEELLMRAALLGIEFDPRYRDHTTMRDVAAELGQNWDRLGPAAATVPAALSPLRFDHFDAAVAEVAALIGHCTDRSDLLFVHLERILAEMSAVVAIADPHRKLAEIASSVNRWGPGSGGKGAAWACDVKAAKATIKAVGVAAEAVVADASDEVLRHLVHRVSREVVAAAEARRTQGGLEFHDLLVLARELLRTRPEVRATLHQRYRHLLLDEFQDTDPIQIELAVLIASTIDGGDPPAWTHVVTEPGRLFFVGDPKQSIYRFRRADIKLFLDARDRFGADGGLARLTTNFRTVAPVLDWVNALFEHEMPTEEPGRQPRYERLDPTRTAAPGADHRPLLLGGVHPDPKVPAGRLREAEAADVAATVAAIAAEPDRWPVKDPHDGSWRPARLADVTILIPTRTSLPYLRDALERRALPYRLATGTLVYDTQELRDVLSVVRAVDDPTDVLSLVAALRSPLYACSDVDLFTFRRAGGEWDVRDRPPPSVPDDHPVRLAMAHLHDLWSERWWTTPAGLIDRILRDRRAGLLAFGDPRPGDVWRRLRFLRDQALAFEEAGGGGLRAFVDWATMQGSDRARVHEPLLPELGDDAVRILTIHGAKGLEFPITILSGMTTVLGRARRGASVIWNDDTGLPEVRMRKGVETASHEPFADLELEMDVHERLRLLYVAATRARDHLVVSCHHKASSRPTETYAGRVATYFAAHPGLCRDGSGSVPADPDPIVDDGPSVDSALAAVVDDRAGWMAARAAVLDPQRIARVVSATAVARAGRDDDVEDDLGDELEFDELEFDDRGATPALPTHRRGRAGTAIGRAVHATLQLVDLVDGRGVDALARRQCDLESIPEHLALVAARVRAALGSDAVALARAHPHHKELYVAAPVGDRVVEGYVDLLIETPDGLVVVDYKTDAVASEAEIDAKLAGYELQGAAYAVALEAATGVAVLECRFVFCQRSGAVERSVPDLRGAMDRARAALGVVAGE